MKQNINLKENLRKGSAVALCLLLAAGPAGADAPNVISYQGRLLDNGVPANGLYDIRFRLCGESACAVPLYTETHNGGNQVIVSTGLFSATIGSITGLPTGLFDGSERWLEVGVGATPTIMLPREKLTATAFSLQAASATTVLDGAITTGKLADGAVTTAKLHGEALLPITLNKAAGRVGIGTTNPSVPFEVQAGDSHIKFMDSGILSLFDHYSAINNYQLRIRRAQGSFPAPSAVLSGDILGELRFNGAINASSFGLGGSMIRGLAAENFAPFSEGTHLSFWTNKTGFDSSGMLEQMRITASGDVGIGATVPGAKLEVAGQVKITGGTPAAGEVLTSDAAGLATWEPSSVADGAITTGKLAADAVTSAKLVDGTVTTAKLHAQALDPAGSLLLQASGGNVGIGTASPAYKLQIVGAAANEQLEFVSSVLNGNPHIRVKANSPAGNAILQADRGDTGARAAVDFRTAASAEWMIGSAVGTTDRLEFLDDTGTPAMSMVKPSRNVGIGTTNPTNRFVVEGTVNPKIVVNSSDGTGAELHLLQSGTTQAAFIANANDTYLDSGSGNDLHLRAEGDSSREIAVKRTSGNVAIGYSDVSVVPNKLGVNGNASIGTNYKTVTAPTDGLIVEGDVGIGTNAPGERLSVVGSGSFSTEVLSPAYKPLTGNANALTIQANDNVNPSTKGGNVNIVAGGSSGGTGSDTNGGDVNITGGAQTGGFSGGLGGDINLTSGNSNLWNAGNINITGATLPGGNNQTGGNINITGGGGNNGTGGSITVTAGNVAGGGTSGSISLKAGSGGANPGKLIFEAGGSEKMRVDGVGHVKVTGAAPSLSCGTPGESIAGTDVAGRIVTGGSNPPSCIVTFATPWPAAPVCTMGVSYGGGPPKIWSMVVTNTTITFSTDVAIANGYTINYICLGI